jgi:hypothetical protein
MAMKEPYVPDDGENGCREDARSAKAIKNQEDIDLIQALKDFLGTFASSRFRELR